MLRNQNHPNQSSLAQTLGGWGGVAYNGVPGARPTGGLLPGLQLSLDFRREGLGW